MAPAIAAVSASRSVVSSPGAEMPTGVVVSPDRSSANVIDNVVSTARAAHEAGVRQVWSRMAFRRKRNA